MSAIDHDRETTELVLYASALSSDKLSSLASHAVVRLHLDSVACAIGALEEAPCRIARGLAKSTTTSSGCSVLGLELPTAPEQAVFANVAMVRQLDFNDTLGDGSTGAGHPSDMIPAIFAAAELVGASGTEMIKGIFLAYEVFAALEHSYALAEAQFDHSGPFTAVGVALGAGLVLGCSREELANALSMALVPNMALLVARKGALSNWKGLASAQGAMAGLFAARLARAGMTGPSAPFAGIGGLHEHVQPERPLEIGATAGANSAVERSSFKYYPAVIYAQDLIAPFIALGKSVAVPEIATICIDTYEIAWRNAGGGSGAGDHEEKWNPKTRETADHSLAYLLATAIVYGDVTPASFSPDQLFDPVVADVMHKISVSPNAEYSARFPAEHVSSGMLTCSDGRIIEFFSEAPLGSRANPMSDADLSAKFARLCAGVLDDATTDELAGLLWGLSELSNLDRLGALYRGFPG